MEDPINDPITFQIETGRIVSFSHIKTKGDYNELLPHYRCLFNEKHNPDDLPIHSLLNVVKDNMNKGKEESEEEEEMTPEELKFYKKLYNKIKKEVITEVKMELEKEYGTIDDLKDELEEALGKIKNAPSSDSSSISSQTKTKKISFPTLKYRLKMRRSIGEEFEIVGAYPNIMSMVPDSGISKSVLGRIIKGVGPKKYKGLIEIIKLT